MLKKIQLLTSEKTEFFAVIFRVMSMSETV